MILTFCLTDMTTKNADVFQGDGGVPDPSPQPGKPDQLHSCGSNTIFKSGPLLLSSKGIGWTSWKKRWFILTRTSLVFFKSDPNAVSQKGSEVNLTLGGIDLNNSGSVVVKADKKLLTVLFPDGRDGRAFTLKAETTEDLNEWKTALENALAQAPSAANVTGQNGAIKNEQTESKDISLDQLKDREPMRSKVIGQPILLALEDADGAPTFLEKGLRFIEEHGVKVEGILRQAADVEDVEFRVQEYEQGKVEFSAEEDAHVIADCVKHLLRELPSSPVPASCCKALLEACRTERARRVSAMRVAICETFPEPNRRLLQRILLMMQAVASHKAENRMSSSAVAACMAPLLLRALLVGECEIENDFDVGGDGSVQLLQAAAAANHAQAIVITLLEEYDSLFGWQEARVSPDMYIESDESETGSEGSDMESYDDDDDDEQDKSVEECDPDEDDDLLSEASSKTGNSKEYHVPDNEDHSHSSPKSSDMSEDLKINQVNSENLDILSMTASLEQSSKPSGVPEGVFTDESTVHHTSSTNASCIKKSVTMSNAPACDSRHHSKWGRTSARKNLSMESIEFSAEDDVGFGTFDDAKTELQNKFAEEVKENLKLQHGLRKQNSPSHEPHLAFEQDMASLQEQLSEEKSSCATLEAGLKLPPGILSGLTSIDDKTKADLEELALLEADLTSLEKKVNDMRIRLNLQHKTNQNSALNFCNKPEQISNDEMKLKNKPDTEVTATPQFGKSRSKDSQLGAEHDGERKLESTSLPCIHPRKIVPRNLERRKRLNFMKDKGRESAHSAQNPEKGKGSEFHQPLPSPNASRGPKVHSVSIPEKGKGAEFRQPLPSPGKSRGSEIHSVPNPEKDRGIGSSFQIPDKGSGKEGPSLEVSDKTGKSGSHTAEHSEKWSQHPQPSERGKSEGHKPYNVDKGR
ncbi:rho GTPase-activating protein REN1 isoform X3 [Prosopis cineraria]|uniref:rho GTPase-activating protein REN1 isoform X3 n=1 Tax=Prosopis cineraria TaxID=364024 RepID=UPI00241071F2|nr:rho GTPase-activating protein REN1 isoform X3 [Prosopis cineraria]